MSDVHCNSTSKNTASTANHLSNQNPVLSTPPYPEPTIYSEIAELMAVKAKHSAGGEYSPDWRPKVIYPTLPR